MDQLKLWENSNYYLKHHGEQIWKVWENKIKCFIVEKLRLIKKIEKNLDFLLSIKNNKIHISEQRLRFH